MPKTEKAVIYARFSSNNQRDESIDAQVRACRSYAEAQGYQIIRVFADRAKTGTTDQRDEFQAMLKAAKVKGSFQVAIVHKLDRFSRDRLEAMLYKRELKLNGVRLESTLERLGDDPESALMESIYFGMAEFYSRNLAREVTKGMNENALSGIFNGGLVPFGFRLNPLTRKLEEEPHEAEAVRLAFEMYLSGIGYERIADRLNALGHITRKGKPFQKTSIHGMLINEKYCGRLYWGKIAPKDERKKRNHHQFNEEYVVIPGGCPALVSAAVFDAAQDKMNGRKRGKREDAKVCWKLSGLVRCGCCGELMKVVPRTSKRVDGTVFKHYYYACRTRECITNSIPKELLEDEVISTLDRAIPPESVREIAQKIVTPPEAQIDLRPQIEATQRRLDNLSSALAEGAPWAAIAPQWEAAEKQKAELEKKQLEQNISSTPSMTVEDAVEFLEKFGVLKTLGDDEQREALHRNVQEIVVSRVEKGKKEWNVRVIVNPNHAPSNGVVGGALGGTGSPVPRNPVRNGWVFVFLNF